MGILNRQIAVSDWVPDLRGWVPAVDPYAEIAARRLTEINVGPSGMIVCPHSMASLPLWDETHTEATTDSGSLAGRLGPGMPVLVSVDSSLCFRRAVDVTGIKSHLLPGMLALDLQRVAPFRREDLLITHWYPAGPGNAVEQLVIRRSVLVTALEAITTAKAKIEAIVIRDGKEPALPVALEPDGLPYGEAAFRRAVRHLGLGVATVTVGLLLTGWSVLAQIDRRQAQIDSATEQVRQDATAVASALDEVKSGSQAIEELLSRRQKRPSILAVIEELSALLPDDAHFDGLGIEGDTVTADGTAVAPEVLISEFEASPLFKNVAFNAPVYKNPGDISARFSLRLELETGEAK